MIPRDTSLRELQKLFADMSGEIAELRAKIDALEIPEDKKGWTKQPLDDSGYNDLLVSPANVRLPASSAPSWGTWLTDLEVLTFSQGDIAHFNGMQLPHGYMPGTDIYPHVHFANTAAIADTETVVWTITYTLAPVWGVFPATATATATFTNNAEARAKLPAASLSGTNIVANTHLISDGATISGVDMTLSGIIQGSIEYDSSSTHASDVIMTSADAHIRINRLGSRAEYTG